MEKELSTRSAPTEVSVTDATTPKRRRLAHQGVPLSAHPESSHRLEDETATVGRMERRQQQTELNEKRYRPKRLLAESGRGFISPTEGLRHFKLGDGLPSLHDLREELDSMTDVLMGRVSPPYPPERVEAMLEVSSAYYARGMEIAGILQRLETDGMILKAHKLSKFRTGELRTFCEMSKSVVDMGSRRITVAVMEREEKYG